MFSITKVPALICQSDFLAHLVSRKPQAALCDRIPAQDSFAHLLGQMRMACRVEALLELYSSFDDSSSVDCLTRFGPVWCAVPGCPDAADRACK